MRGEYVRMLRYLTWRVRGMGVRERIGLGIKTVTLAICCYMLLHGRPPAAGQEINLSPLTGRGQTVEDAIQDHDISDIKGEQKAMRDASTLHSQQIEDIGKELAGIEMEFKMLGGILVLLNGGNLLVSFRKRDS